MKDKLDELRETIKRKNKQFLDAENKAVLNKDITTYDSLKQKRLQCEAELRLIKFIENDFEGDFVIC